MAVPQLNMEYKWHSFIDLSEDSLSIQFSEGALLHSSIMLCMFQSMYVSKCHFYCNNCVQPRAMTWVTVESTGVDEDGYRMFVDLIHPYCIYFRGEGTDYGWIVLFMSSGNLQWKSAMEICKSQVVTCWGVADTLVRSNASMLQACLSVCYTKVSNWR